jgi:RNase adaptor protein for sRNA GlmZ degradation
MSDAGRSTVQQILADLGNERFDNLPAFIVPALIESAGGRTIAVAADRRSRRCAGETILDTLFLRSVLLQP